MHGHHNEALVFLALLIAVVASYTALDLAGRFGAAATRSARAVWLAGAAFSLGGGIWSMHFVAMLAYSMPGMQPSYDLGLTTLSFFLAVGATGVGFSIVGHVRQRALALLLSGPLMGFGIAAMHYTGMAALQIPMSVSYDPAWVAISLLISITAATAALWLAFMNTGQVEKFIAAVVMGAAISGMHFSGMHAAVFSPLPGGESIGMHSVNHEGLAAGISAITFVILSLALIAATLDRRMAQQSRREAELLKASEERFRLLYRRTPLPLHAVDRDDRILDISDAWLALLGFDRDQVIGRPVWEFMTPASAQDRMKATRWPLEETERIHKVQAALVSRSGKVIEVEIARRIEVDAKGEFLSCIEGLVDVTARNEAEIALRQTQKMEVLGQLTGGVAHDFNNLLAIILGNLELLRKGNTDAQRARQLIEVAIQGVQRGSMLTQRMLAFARRQTLAPEPVDVIALINGMVDLLQRSLGPQYELQLPQADLVAVANVDENQLEMALLNLIVNARDAMPEGGLIKVIVETLGTDPSSRQIAVKVVDHGSGMDAETLARATDPFFTTKGPTKGTGLGLSMVHGFAAQSGGRLHLSSTPGEGTEATILLQAAEAPVVAEPVRTFPEQAPAQKASSTIMAVDDDLLVLMNTQAMLEDMGHRVIPAHNGEEALRLLDKTGDVDLVITDQAMPRMTGLQLAEAIQVRHPNLPVILATGYAELPTDHPNIAFKLDKPYFQAQLEKAVLEALRSRQDPKVIPFKLPAS
ncbi:MHYT domain-containing protein [Paracoccus sp. WLY502]|uniref:MHYT domain-containing protein n=1 Tax=Paracoccus yibinensis TaxID=3068891 RepID=UPI00279661FE|nr:MHYT domain-containing protein [Paracoccus sp. WLY502]MDQ1902260.1 MHYT domain-containing protein [Paracoccus sp. WLY502]